VAVMNKVHEEARKQSIIKHRHEKEAQLRTVAQQKEHQAKMKKEMLILAREER